MKIPNKAIFFCKAFLIYVDFVIPICVCFSVCLIDVCPTYSAFPIHQNFYLRNIDVDDKMAFSPHLCAHWSSSAGIMELEYVGKFGKKIFQTGHVGLEKLPILLEYAKIIAENWLGIFIVFKRSGNRLSNQLNANYISLSVRWARFSCFFFSVFFLIGDPFIIEI